jgi:hypothetical protein
MQNPELRDRLLNALVAIEMARPTSFRAALDFFAIYLPGAEPEHDAELADAFRRVVAAVEEAQALNDSRTRGDETTRTTTDQP